MHPDTPAAPVSLLLVGHGAGGGVDAPDLLAVRAAALAAGVAVVRVEQPYRVAGRRTPPPAAHLDDAWRAVVEAVRADPPMAGLPLVLAGRSSGARVACRTATALGAAAVVALAFPLHPPGKPDRSRLAELDAPDVPVLVVQGARDPFGMPPAGPDRTVRVVPGDHSLRPSADRVAEQTVTWLRAHGLARAATDHHVNG
ncbi:MAG TPA: alpha/beta family hydrolase [Mycobacteriales bacterium]|nr:alpha/beta family hydrolase [Mycobacteriales bacterium]